MCAGQVQMLLGVHLFIGNTLLVILLHLLKYIASNLLNPLNLPIDDIYLENLNAISSGHT